VGQERKAAELKDTEIVKFVSAATTLKPNEQTVRLDSSGGAYTVTMPPVVECFGLFYSFHKVEAAANAVTIVDGGDAEVALSDNHIDADAEGLVLYSDGRKWQIVATY
jgi:hypothetical protein